jgi:HAD superfamily hydrolase (TIGR01509 family)
LSPGFPPRPGSTAGNACLVLDFDGTILDTEEPLYRSWAELWAEHGHRLALADWQDNIGSEDLFDPLIELEQRLGRPLDTATQDRRRRRRDEIQARNRPRPGVLRWLSEAHGAGIPVGVASSSSTEWVEGQLIRLGLRDSFSCLVCRDVGIPVKPAPTSYRMACERLGSDPIRSVAVEDSPHGVAAAVAAGLFTVAVPHGLTSDLDLSAADLVVASLDDLSLADAMGRAGTPGRRDP